MFRVYLTNSSVRYPIGGFYFLDPPKGLGRDGGFGERFGSGFPSPHPTLNPKS